MNRLDAIIDKVTRKIARRSSRRRFLARLGSTLAVASALQLLPVKRSHGAVPKPLKRGSTQL